MTTSRLRACEEDKIVAIGAMSCYKSTKTWRLIMRTIIANYLKMNFKRRRKSNLIGRGGSVVSIFVAYYDNSLCLNLEDV